MSKEEDQSIESEQKLLDLRVRQITKATPVDYLNNPKGVCLWCGEPTGVNKRFCDPICARDWERYGE